MKTRFALVVGVLSAALSATACSGSKADSTELTSPLLRAGTTANALTGTVNGLGGACPTVAFKLEQRAIRTDANTVFADITCALLKNLVRVEVSGTVQADGSILATRVHLLPPVASPPAPPSTPSYVSAVGVVSGLSGACPAIAFKIEQRIIKADANTVYGDYKCTDVKNDIRVELAGIVQTDGSLLAVKLHPTTSNPPTVPPPSPPPTNPAPVGMVGTTSALSGTCPVLTFKLEQRSIRTDANTVFGDSKCADLRNELRVEISGVVQADGSILALKVRIVPPVTTPPPPPPSPPGIAGAVTAITGTCPSLIITVSTRKAITNSATVFDGKPCAELQVGMGVEIVGAQSSTNDALVALKVIWRK